MKAYEIAFRNGSMEVLKGISVHIVKRGLSFLVTSNNRRLLDLPFMRTHPPEMRKSVLTDRKGAEEVISLSLVPGKKGELFAVKEYDELRSFLLLVDTLDSSKVELVGTYLVSLQHDERLPYGGSGEDDESEGCHSSYGLILLRPGDSCVVQSTNGMRQNIFLNEEGQLLCKECDPIELKILQDNIFVDIA